MSIVAVKMTTVMNWLMRVDCMTFFRTRYSRSPPQRQASYCHTGTEPLEGICLYLSELYAVIAPAGLALLMLDQSRKPSPHICRFGAVCRMTQP